MTRSLYVLVLMAIWPTTGAAGQEGRGNSELTIAAAKTALQGWQLFQAGKFVAAAHGGHYTDPDPDTQVRDFWSNRRWAMLDRNGDGHHETIFLVENKQLIYVGCLNSRGLLINPASRFKPHTGKSRDEVIRCLQAE